MSDVRVLIVGSGPTGLTLACLLAERNVSFRIIDAAPAPPTGSRGKGLQPRSLELLDGLGLAERIIAHGRFDLPIQAHGDVVRTRDFDGHRFSSEMAAEDGILVERFGPLRFRFDLPADGAGLAMAMRGWSAFRIPLPLALAPRSIAREWEDGGRFRFDVAIALPLLGPLVRYRGWLG